MKREFDIKEQDTNFYLSFLMISRFVLQGESFLHHNVT